MSSLKGKNFIEVLNLISGYSEIEKKAFLVNDEIEITGTLSDFKELREELNDESNTLRRAIYELEIEINQPISSIEVYNYFKELTNGFSREETRITLREMNCFRDMVLNEELDHLAKLEYIQNKWPIPTYTKTGKIGTFEFEDVKKMRDIVFPLHGLLFYEAMSLLKRKLAEGNPDHQTKNSPTVSHNTERHHLKIKAAHHVLAYVFDCHANGISLLIGKKKALEGVGNDRIGVGKGNRFYKVFNEIIQRDLNNKRNLLEIGGEEWREIVTGLSRYPGEVEEYLQSKKL